MKRFWCALGKFTLAGREKHVAILTVEATEGLVVVCSLLRDRVWQETRVETQGMDGVIPLENAHQKKKKHSGSSESFDGWITSFYFQCFVSMLHIQASELCS